MQDEEQVPLSQSREQPPPEQVVEQVAESTHSKEQLDPEQEVEQVALSSQRVEQPPPEQLTLQLAVPAHTKSQPPPTQENEQWPEVQTPSSPPQAERKRKERRIKSIKNWRIDDSLSG